jgi:hypothetical protein
MPRKKEVVKPEVVADSMISFSSAAAIIIGTDERPMMMAMVFKLLLLMDLQTKGKKLPDGWLKKVTQGISDEGITLAEKHYPGVRADLEKAGLIDPLSSEK